MTNTIPLVGKALIVFGFTWWASILTVLVVVLLQSKRSRIRDP